jgi:DNA invertase Pin-like site-specific DNA recombinase
MFTKVSVKARRRISDETSKAIRQDAKAGMTVQELIDKYTFSQSTILRHMIAPPQDRKGLTEFQARDIRKMYKEGVSQTALAREFKVSVERVRQACIRRSG